MNPIKWCGGAGDEYTNLIYESISRVKFAIGGEWCAVKGKKQRRSHTLVYGVFSDVDKEERHYVWDKK